jgi:hypothetical protein
LGLDCLAVDLDAARCKLDLPTPESPMRTTVRGGGGGGGGGAVVSSLPCAPKSPDPLSPPLGPQLQRATRQTWQMLPSMRGRRREIETQFKLARAAHGRMHVCWAPTFEKVVVLIVLARHGCGSFRATHTQPLFLLPGSNVPALSRPSIRQLLSPTPPVSLSYDRIFC